MTTTLTPSEEFQLMLQCLSVALLFVWWFSCARPDPVLDVYYNRKLVRDGGCL